MAARSPESLAFGRALRKVRQRRGLSQEQAALDCGVARAYFGKVERGQASPTYEMIVKLATGLQLAPSELVDCADRHRRDGTAIT